MSEDIIVWQQGFVKGFKLGPYDTELYSSVLGYYEGKQVEFCIREVIKKPSKEAHGYYRGIILPTAKNSETFRGWRIDDIHKYFTSKYLKNIIERQMGDHTVMIVTTQSTGDINAKTMNQFINDVIQELSELGIPVKEAIKQPKI